MYNNNNNEKYRGRGGRGGYDNRGRGRGRGRGDLDCNSSWQRNDSNNWNTNDDQNSAKGASNAWLNSSPNLQQNWSSTVKNNNKSHHHNKSGWGNKNRTALNTGWDTTSSLTNNTNSDDGWGTNPSSSSNTGWDSQKSSDSTAWGVKQESNDNNSTWVVNTNTNKDKNESDGWGDANSGTSSNWNPENVSWVKSMNEPEKKEPGRGEWKDGKHIISDRDPQIELKLFGDAESMNTGINFTQYDSIPVEIKGDEKFQPMEKFTDPPLDSLLLSNIELTKFTIPTPVQKYSIPIVLANRDIMACAQTGSGKTAGFLFPVLTKLYKEGPEEFIASKNKKGSPSSSDRDRKAYPEVLILAPTRELASQIYNEAKKFAYRSYVRPCVVYGGADIGNQLRMLSRKCQLLVATPGRLVDILERRRLSLSRVRYLILDEADRMLDMGFEPQIRRIIQGEDMPLPGQRQTLMFSATFPNSIQSLASEFLHDYVFFTVGRVGRASENITQNILQVDDENKREKLLEILQSQQDMDGLTLIFVETKRMADNLCQYLIENRKSATSIHGDRIQQEREEALQSFRSGQTPILVATAVAARGLDIPNVNHVISYDLPKEIDDYTHRIGRTARAGNTGLATAFFNQRSNRSIAADMVKLLTEANQQVPEWLRKIADDYIPEKITQEEKYQRYSRNHDNIGVRISKLKF
ncbi:unnamed protein product [Cunninghamella blakesleeana]